MIFIPPGCLHGFLSLEDDTIFQYKVTDFWSPNAEVGIKWDDPDLNINWKLKEYGIKTPKASIKDKKLITIKEFLKRD